MPLSLTLLKYLKNYKNGIYLETGFLEGDSSLRALELGFEKVISIELDEQRIKKGKTRLKKYIDNNRLEIVHGNSAEKIESVLENNPNIKVIFLDAHHYTKSEDLSAPPEKELLVIKKFYNKNYFLIIDDFYQIKQNHKVSFNNWRKKHNHKEIIKKVRGISDFCSEIYYRHGLNYKGTINSYLVSVKLNRFKLLFYKLEVNIMCFIFTNFIKTKLILNKLIGRNQ